MKSQYSEFNFGLGETLDMLREQINGFAASEIAPRAEAIDHDNLFPNDLWKKFGDMGLLGITVDEAYGGSGMGYLAHVIACLLYTSPSPRDKRQSRMPSSA